MLRQDIVHKWDEGAASIRCPQVNRDVYNLDLELWSMVYRLAGKKQMSGSVEFLATQAFLKVLTKAKPDQLRILASGTLLSFRPIFPGKAIAGFLEKSQIHSSPEGFYGEASGEFYTAYWLLFCRMAADNLNRAKVVFGLPDCIADKLATASDRSLRQMSAAVAVKFEPRFETRIVENVLDRDNHQIGWTLVKKMQQSLQ